MMNQYGSVEFWEERQSRDTESFDWQQRWKDIKQYVKEQFNDTSKLLIAGCGTSRLADDLNEDQNHLNITSIDFSNTLIDKMMDKRNAGLMTYHCADIRNTGLEERQYDIIIDKACLDSILCGENSKNNVKKALEEIYRLLKNEGVQILITFGKPEARMKYLKNDNLLWDININEIPKLFMPNNNELANKDSNEPKGASIVNSSHQIYSCKKKVNNMESESIKFDTNENSSIMNDQ